MNEMFYDELMTQLSTRNQHQIKLGLSAIEQLLLQLRNPHHSLSYIHVAGTNGKGTIVHALHQELLINKVNVASFTSPCISQVNEQIKVNNDLISDEELTYYASLVEKANRSLVHSATDFELLVALALLYFSHQQVDIVIMEVGMGGRLDATNIIPPPLVHIITQISQDHVSFLSDDLKKIAKEKAGIIKSNHLTVSYPQIEVVEEVIKKEAEKYGSELFIAQSNQSIEKIYEDILKTTLIYLSHKWQRSLREWIPLKELPSLPARMEVIYKKPNVILDGAHNEAALVRLLDKAEKDVARKKIAIFGILEDKTFDSLLERFSNVFDYIILTEPESARALSMEKLKELFEKAHINVLESFKDPTKALQYALDEAQDDDQIYIFGSFYLAHPIKEWLNK